ncbi:MAG: phosphatase PAP2 family protein [candidate division Zixibacteria bacterium]|nr:phosphatase PAP2 family protein [candidate division Zixibacteria bacterium]
MIKNMLRKFLLTDFICLLYCAFQFIYVMVFGFGLENQAYVMFVYLACAAGSLFCVIIRNKFDNKLIKIITSLYPIAFFIPLYSVSGQQVTMFFDRFFDSYIIDLESAIFSIHPTIWFQKLDHVIITEWMMFGYSFYLLLIPITTGWLFLTDKKNESEHMLSGLMLSFFICYILFSLIPVTGPRLAMADLYTVEFGGFIFKAITEAMESKAMLVGGAFPSAHCSAATVMLLLSYKYDRKLYFWVAPIIITLYISTIYGRYHYPTDVIAGILVGILGIKLYYPLKRWWMRAIHGQY